MLGTKKAAAPQPQSLGEKQTIPARHGTATFVPKGHTIKIINTYGRQVVDTWAFALGAPPDDDDIDEEGKGEANGGNVDVDEATLGATEDVTAPVEVEKETETANAAEAAPQSATDEVKESADAEGIAHGASDEVKEDVKDADAEDVAQNAPEEVKEGVGGPGTEGNAQGGVPEVKEGVKETEKDGAEASKAVEDTKTDIPEEVGKTTEKVTEKVEGETPKRTWSSYVPTLRRSRPEEPKEKEGDQEEKKDDEQKLDATASTTDTAKDTTDGAQKTAEGAAKKTNWSAYVPKLPSVRSMQPKKPKQPKQQRTWASYLPSGTGFSAYNTAKSSFSAFMSQHQRDPTKSLAEQLYDFSKTPVGAAGLSAATGSGYAGSIYAAYKAYDMVDSAAAGPPMEYMSMPHCHASTLHLSPRVGDTMASNLRAPIMTMLEDSSRGAHDTLIAACDPQRYKELGVEKWEEHGSCAENLVFALKEINEKSGLKGRKAIGRDVTVNMVPAPLNLFMNIPWTQEGDVSFEAPDCKRGDFVKFRAERDLVVVMSACPQDVLSINGGKPMVAHFVVESGSEEDRKAAEEKDKEAQKIIEKARLRSEAEKKTRTAPQVSATPKKAAPKKLATGDGPKPGTQPAKPKSEAPKKIPTGDVQERTERAQSTPSAAPLKSQSQRTPSVPAAKAPNGATAQPVKRKPKKLERRSTPTTMPTTKA